MGSMGCLWGLYGVCGIYGMFVGSVWSYGLYGMFVGSVWGAWALWALWMRAVWGRAAAGPVWGRGCGRFGGPAVLIPAVGLWDPAELFGVVEPIVAELREAGVAVWVMGAGRNPAGAEDLNEALEAAPEELRDEDVWRPPDMGETALYIFTSGTTGEPGLLIAPVTPRTPFLGYAGRPELSEQKLLRGVFAEGDTFFSTGDLMEEDSDGFVRFCDRTGDTFRWKGENVATTEVAEALLAHAALRTLPCPASPCQVRPQIPQIPHSRSRPPARPAPSPPAPSPNKGHEGRAGMAAVVLRPGWELDGAELFRHVAAALPPYAWPRFIRLQERLALTPTFKQQKALLAQEGCDPSRVAAPLLLLDLPAAAYVPMGPALWDGVVAGRIRL
uniref:long-chain-fatty-acid--CoA ligase n=1 Tax=Chrysolophus pictus TaxID=9089 RepID=A0A8C3LVL6_CHRPC